MFMIEMDIIFTHGIVRNVYKLISKSEIQSKVDCSWEVLPWSENLELFFLASY